MTLIVIHNNCQSEITMATAVTKITCCSGKSITDSMNIIICIYHRQKKKNWNNITSLVHIWITNTNERIINIVHSARLWIQRCSYGGVSLIMTSIEGTMPYEVAVYKDYISTLYTIHHLYRKGKWWEGLTLAKINWDYQSRYRLLSAWIHRKRWDRTAVWVMLHRYLS